MNLRELVKHSPCPYENPDCENVGDEAECVDCFLGFIKDNCEAKLRMRDE